MKKLSIATAALGLASMTVSMAADRTLYNNADTSLNRNLYETVEFGDQIILNNDFLPSARLSSFLFQYAGENFSGDETARIRFYRNDGDLGKPGTLVFDSQEFDIPVAPAGATIDLGDLGGVVVPGSFTWTVSFGGVNAGTGETAGLSLFSPPSVGSGFTDYWARNGNDWSLKTVPDADASFAAIIAGTPVIPEPSTWALSIAGGMLLLGRLLKDRKCRR